MKDGASVHVTDRTLDLLDRQFRGRVVSRNRRRGHFWPPRSDQYYVNLKSYLWEMFYGQLSRNCFFKIYPLRSPDLNVLDYFCWGFLKWKTYQPLPGSLQQLNQQIQFQVATLDPAMVSRACADLVRRCHAVVAAQGGYIE